MSGLKNETSPFRVGSLYAGVGGICLGFKNAGFEMAWANEWDARACQTYRHNFDHRLIEGDVWKVDLNSLEPVDVLTAGFPCQPFSVAGYRKGFDDDRGNHFFRILEFVDHLPKVVFLEMSRILLRMTKATRSRSSVKRWMPKGTVTFRKS